MRRRILRASSTSFAQITLNHFTAMQANVDRYWSDITGLLKDPITYTYRYFSSCMMAKVQGMGSSEAELRSRRIVSDSGSDSDSGLKISTPTPTPTPLRLRLSNRHSILKTATWCSHLPDFTFDCIQTVKSGTWGEKTCSSPQTHRGFYRYIEGPQTHWGPMD